MSDKINFYNKKTNSLLPSILEGNIAKRSLANLTKIVGIALPIIGVGIFKSLSDSTRKFLLEKSWSFVQPTAKACTAFGQFLIQGSTGIVIVKFAVAILVVATVAAAVFFIVVREKPPVSREQEKIDLDLKVQLDREARIANREKCSDKDVEYFFDQLSKSNLTINSKEMAHVALNGHVKDTSLEGLNKARTTKILCSLQRLLPSGVIPQKVINRFEKLHKVCSEIQSCYKTFEEDKDKDLRLQRLTKNIAKEIRNLKSGDSILLPGGYRGDPYGHAMYYRISKQGKYWKMVIVNSGEGSEMGNSTVRDEIKNKICPYFVFSSLSEKDLFPYKDSSLPGWLHYLFLLQVEEQGQDYKADSIYKVLTGYFKKSNDPLDPIAKLYATPQFDGLCTWHGLKQLFRLELNAQEGLYKRLMIYFKLGVSTLFSKQCDPESEEDRNIAIQSIKNISKRIAKGYKNGFINKKELKEFHGIISEIIKNEKIQLEKDDLLNEIRFSKQENRKVNLRSKENQNKISLKENEIVEKKSDSDLQREENYLFFCNPSSDNFHDQIHQIQDYLSQQEKCADSNSSTSACVELFFEKIPLCDAKFWDKVSVDPQKSKELIQNIRKLMDDYLRISSVNDDVVYNADSKMKNSAMLEKGASPSSAITVTTAMISCFEILRRTYPELDRLCPANFLTKMEMNPFFVLSEGEKDALKNIEKYYKGRENKLELDFPPNFKIKKETSENNDGQYLFYSFFYNQNNQLKNECIKAASGYNNALSSIKNQISSLYEIKKDNLFSKCNLEFVNDFIAVFCFANGLSAMRTDRKDKKENEFYGYPSQFYRGIVRQQKSITGKAEYSVEFDDKCFFSLIGKQYPQLPAEVYDLLALIYKKRLDSQGKQGIDTQEAFSLSMDSSKSKGKGIAYDFVRWAGGQTASQDVRLLSTFINYISFLGHEDFQTVFWLEFFGQKGGHDLKKQVEENISSVDLVCKFVRKGINSFPKLEKQDLEGKLFFIRFATKFARAMQNAELPQDKKNMINDLLDHAKKTLLEISADKNKMQNIHGYERRLLYLHLLDLHLTLFDWSRDPQLIENILSYWVGFNMAFNRKTSLSFLERSVHRKMVAFLSENHEVNIKNLFQKAFFLFQNNAIFELEDENNNVEDQPKKLKLRETPKGMIKYGSFEIQTHTGKLYHNGNCITSGIKNFYSEPIYNHLFGNDKISFLEKEGYHYFSHSKGNFRIYFSQGKFNLQLQYKNKWHSYVPFKQFSSEEARGYSIPQSLVANHHHFIDPISKDIVIVEDKEKIDLSKPKAKWSLNGKLILCSTNKEVAPPFLDKRNDFLEKIKIFDDPNYHTITFHHTDQVKITLNRCFSLQGKTPLSFSQQPGGVVSCDQEPGFVVSSNSAIRDLNGLSDYLVLQNGDSYKVLIPNQSINSTLRKPFSAKATLKRVEEKLNKLDGKKLIKTIKEEAAEKLPYFTYDLDQDGNLTPQSVEGMIFLIYLQLHTRNYQRALQLIDALSPIDNLSQQTYIDTITFGLIKNKHHTPQTIALVLRLAIKHLAAIQANDLAVIQSKANQNFDPSLGLEYKERYGQDSIQERYREIFKHYKNYLDSYGKVPLFCQLSKDDELFLLDCMRNHNLRMYRELENREHMLKGEARSYDGSQRITSNPLREFSENKIDFSNSNFCVGSLKSIEPKLDVQRLSLHNISPSYKGKRFSHFLKVAIEGSDEERDILKSTCLHFLLDDTVYSVGSLYKPQIKFLVILLHMNKENLKNLYNRLIESGKEGRDVLKEISQDKAFIAIKETLEKELSIKSKKILTPSTSSPQQNKSAPLSLLQDQQNWFKKFCDQSCKFYQKVKKDFQIEKEIIKEEINNDLATLKNKEQNRFYADCIQRKKDHLTEDMKVGAKRLEAEKAIVTIPNLAKTKLSLEERLKSLQHQHKKLEKSFIDLANKESIDEANRLRDQLCIIGEQKTKVTLGRIVDLFLLQDLTKYQQTNSYLTNEEIQELFGQTSKYLTLSVEIERIKRGLEKLDKIQRLGTKQQKARDYHCYEFDRIMSQDFALFNHQDHLSLPTKLVFSYFSHKVPREDQTRDINKILGQMMCEESGTVKKVMGGGKSSIFAPFISYITAKKGKLPILLVDSSQYPTISRLLKKSQKTCFNQEVFSFSYTKAQLTTERLKWILKDLKSAKERGRLLIITPHMLQLLDEIRFFELGQLINVDESEGESIKEKIKITNQICRFLKEEGNVLGDEIDLLVRTDHELNLPRGKKQPIPDNQVQLMQSIFLFMAENLHNQIGLDQGRQVGLKKEDWKTKILPKLGDHLMNYQPLKLSNDWADSFKRFIANDLDKNNEKDQNFIQHLSDLLNSEDKTSVKKAQLIGFARYAIDLMQECFKQSNRRHYGRWLDLGDQQQAKTPGKVIPYEAANTPAHTEFELEISALIYHFMVAYEEGVDQSQFEKIAYEMLETAKAVAKSTHCSIDETSQGELFLRITGAKLSSVKKTTLNRIFQQVNNDLKRRINFEALAAKETIRFYSSKSASTSQSLEHLVSCAFGMSGTTWNKAGYPKSLKNKENFIPDLGADGKILKTTLDRKHLTHVYSVDNGKNEGLKQLLSQALANGKDQFPSNFFDAAGIFKDLSGVQVARTVLKFCQENQIDKKGVVFFYKKQNEATANHPAVLITVKNDDPSALHKYSYKVVLLDSLSSKEIKKKVGLQIKELAVFLDENRTTGTDMQFPINTRGLVTVDDKTSCRTDAQAKMRHRLYCLGQPVDYVVSKAFMKDKPDGQNDVLYLVQSTIEVEAKMEADSFYRALYQKIDQVFKHQARTQLADWIELPQDDRKQIISVYEPFLFPKKQQDLCRLFLGWEEEISPLEKIKQHSVALVKQFENLSKQINNPDLRDRLEKDMKTIQENINAVLKEAEDSKEILPIKVMSSSLSQNKHSASASVEIEIDQNLSAEIDQKVESDLNLELENEIKRYNKLDHGEKRPETIWSESSAINMIEQLKANQLKNLQEDKNNPIHSVGWSFDQINKEYSRFGSIFSNGRFLMTKNFRLPKSAALPVFSKEHRLARQMLVVKQKSGQFAFVLVSQQEAAFFKQFLKDKKTHGIWLIASSGDLLCNSADPLPDEPEIASGLLAVNFFDGNLSQIVSLNQSEQLQNWIRKDPKLTDIKQDYLYLKCQCDQLRIEKNIFKKF